jgi:cobalamin biosynthetic protein CobC
MIDDLVCGSPLTWNADALRPLQPGEKASKREIRSKLNWSRPAASQLAPRSRTFTVSDEHSPSGEGGATAPGEGEAAYHAGISEDCTIVVAVNPNNPDGRSWTPEHVLDCADEMAGRRGLLIVDEAFADVAPDVSVAPYAGREGLLVLRSFGKFFGLAGVRLGFALGPQQLVARITELLGPWAVSGPAVEIGTQALRDAKWQIRARMTCVEKAARLSGLLTDAGIELVGGAPLFRLARHDEAQRIHSELARQGIWVRRFDDHPQWLRFGLPGGEAEFKRLAAALP